MTFAEDIERAAGGDAIEAVTIGPFGWSSDPEDADDTFGLDNVPERGIATRYKGKPLMWAVARPMLDYEYDNGYGAPDCHAVYVWTANKVLWVTQYDGSTRLSSAPRHPLAITPDMPGG